MFLVVSFQTMFASAADKADTLALVPKPVHLQQKQGNFELNSKTVIFASKGADDEARKLAESLRITTGYPLPIIKTTPTENCILLELDTALEKKLGSEGYELNVSPRRVTIRAAGTAGLFYGGITFKQLFPPSIYSPSKVTNHWKAPCVAIEDYPRFVWRGLHLDVSR
ncbi:MAG: glycoside hydrolase family 20 zincin-like fold domain-containing protein, partial [Thermoguttaceae bacterium]